MAEGQESRLQDRFLRYRTGVQGCRTFSGLQNRWQGLVNSFLRLVDWCPGLVDWGPGLVDWRRIKILFSVSFIISIYLFIVFIFFS